MGRNKNLQVDESAVETAALRRRGGLAASMFGGIAKGIAPESEELLRCREDLYYLATEVLGYRDVEPELHMDYCRFISFATNPKRKKLDLMPREHFKTTLGTVALSIQEMLRDPDTTILISNYTWDNARKMLDEIKHHFTLNERFIGMAGRLVGERWNEDQITISTRTRPNKTPTIETAGLERTLTSAHYKLVILDDLVSRENISSVGRIEGVIKYYQDILDLLDKVEGRLVIHGTRWGFYELYGWILKHHAKDFDLYLRRAIEKGKIIFPKRFSRETLAELRRQKGLGDFSNQYFNFVLDLKNALVGSNEINHYAQSDLARYLEKYPLYITMVVDGAVEESNESCETAITVVGTTVNDEWILLDEKVGHWGPSEVVRQMVYSIQTWHPVKFGMQKTHFEKLYRVMLEGALAEAQVYCPEIVMLEKNPAVSKHMQIMSMRSRIERKGLFWLPTHERFEFAARQYPNTVQKDVLDSLSRHTEISERPYYSDRSGRPAFKSMRVEPERLPWNLV